MQTQKLRVAMQWELGKIGVHLCPCLGGKLDHQRQCMGAAARPFTCNAEVSLLLPNSTQLSTVASLNLNPAGKESPGNLVQMEGSQHNIKPPSLT